MHRLAQLDHRYLWHPFTQMRDWLAGEPVVIVSGHGALLRDVQGREYLDANSSIWTNLHGHNHPRLNEAIRRQLAKIAHSSALGLANEPATLLAERLIETAHTAFEVSPSRPAPRGQARKAGPQGPHRTYPQPTLDKVFFSDDGSTALEVALKLAYEFARRAGRTRRPRFLSLQGAYHGDTVGAASLGHIDLFHKAFRGLLFKSDQVMAPYCYRCPFNQAKPERADARAYRKCRWECVDQVEARLRAARKSGNPYAAMVLEPLIQGAAGMIPQPAGWLARVAELVRSHGVQLIADEVMTGFGRTTPPPRAPNARDRTSPRTAGRSLLATSVFACAQEGVTPDFLVLAKGLTGGYLPMAATLTTQAVFDAFLGEYSEFKTFFHGHSYTANQLGAAAALQSLALLQSPVSLRARQELGRVLEEGLRSLWELPNVGDIRQAGLIGGVELVRDWRTRAPFDLRERAGIRVCEALARRGVLTRPIGNVIVLMPPYCVTRAQVARMIEALRQSIGECLGR